MSLERKDIRAKLDADMHGALVALAEVDQCDIGEWVERELVAVIKRRLHEANLIHAAMTRLGITGSNADGIRKIRE